MRELAKGQVSLETSLFGEKKKLELERRTEAEVPFCQDSLK